jgi:CelD/BcsL family acetyltransferase involved in cellulose biosynthesis
MPDIDLLRLDRTPANIGGQPNPLLMLRGVVPARRSGKVVVIPESVDAYLHERGKKYRKEVERCHRLWEKEGAPRFYRAATPEEAVHVYSVLEEQQAARFDTPGRKFSLDEQEFYERLAIDGSDAGVTSLFALESNGQIIATLFGIVHEDTFTLLQLGTGGEAWSHLSPGRLVIIETMKHCVAQGIRRFDFGPGDHPFKRSFGVEDVPLFELIVARDLAVVPRAVYHRLWARLRKNPCLQSVYRLLKRQFAR